METRNKMKKKQVIKLNENQLDRIIKESLKMVLRESPEIEDVECYNVLNKNFDGNWRDVLMARLYNENDECVGTLHDLHFKYVVKTDKFISDSLI